MSRWISTAHRAASTALANSTNAPSPVFLTMRPRYSAILGSISVLRSALTLATVLSSSTPTSRLYPTTSATSTAANRLSTRSSTKRAPNTSVLPPHHQSMEVSTRARAYVYLGPMFILYHLRRSDCAPGHFLVYTNQQAILSRQLRIIRLIASGPVTPPPAGEARWLEHDPEKHALGPRPDGWVPVFPLDKREVCPEIMLKQKYSAG